jgi:nitroreductase
LARSQQARTDAQGHGDARAEVVSLPEFDFATQQSLPYDGRFVRPSRLVDAPNPMMPLLDAIWTRRTSRGYADRPVDRETFDWLVAQAMNAPTACNEQQWKLILIDDPAIIMDLYERGSASFLKNAKQCFLVCYNRRSDNREWADHTQSGAAFIATFQLVAHTVGVGSCWIGHLPNKSELRRVFNIHRAYEPVALVTFGYYRNKVKILPRKRDVSKIIMHNRFVPEGLVFENPRRTLFRTVARYAYYKIPAFFRRRLKPYTKRFEKKFYYETFD